MNKCNELTCILCIFQGDHKVIEKQMCVQKLQVYWSVKFDLEQGKINLQWNKSRKNEREKKILHLEMQ